MIRYIVFIVGITWLLGEKLMAQADRSQKNHLEERLQAMQWKKRVLILYAPTLKYPQYVKQLKMLRTVKDELRERDVVQMELTNDNTDAPSQAFLQQELDVQPMAFQLILVGKDGGVKYRTTKATKPQEIFSTIDAMPMRQSEMREKGKQE